VLFYELLSRNGVDELRFEVYLSDADELTLYKVIYIYDVLFNFYSLKWEISPNIVNAAIYVYRMFYFNQSL